MVVRSFCQSQKEMETIDDIGVVKQEDSKDDGISPTEDDDGHPVKMDNVRVVRL